MDILTAAADSLSKQPLKTEKDNIFGSFGVWKRQMELCQRLITDLGSKPYSLEFDTSGLEKKLRDGNVQGWMHFSFCVSSLSCESSKAYLKCYLHLMEGLPCIRLVTVESILKQENFSKPCFCHNQGLDYMFLCNLITVMRSHKDGYLFCVDSTHIRPEIKRRVLVGLDTVKKQIHAAALKKEVLSVPNVLMRISSVVRRVHAGCMKEPSYLAFASDELVAILETVIKRLIEVNKQ